MATDEVATMKEQQKQCRKQRLNEQIAIPAEWNLPGDIDMDSAK